MARVLIALFVVIAAVYAAPADEEARKLIPLPLPLPLPPLPGLGLLPPQLRFGKPGLCPYVTRLVPPGIGRSASVCGNLCTDDSYCPSGQKCCPHECGYSCFNPIVISRN